MDKKIVRKMIKRIESVPESYDQSVFYIEESNRSPCGTVACLAGEAVICSAKTVEAGIKLAFEDLGRLLDRADKVLGLPPDHSVFAANGRGWPEPHRSNFAKATTGKARSQVAVAYLKEALKRGTMVWETGDTDGN